MLLWLGMLTLGAGLTSGCGSSSASPAVDAQVLHSYKAAYIVTADVMELAGEMDHEKRIEGFAQHSQMVGNFWTVPHPLFVWMLHRVQRCAELEEELAK